MQPTPAIPYGRISLFFILIVAILTWGFYKTYIIFFPSFTGFSTVQHFHGAMMMTWMIMLIVQPLLIRFGKINFHRIVGKLSYVIAPLLIISIFLINKMVYFRADPVPHNVKIGDLALGFSNFFSFAILYLIAILNRKNTYDHMRYMIGTSFLMIGPGLGRALILYYNIVPDKAVDYVIYLEVSLAALLMINDIFRKRSFKASGLVFFATCLVLVLWTFKMGSLWQGIGEFIAKNLF